MGMIDSTLISPLAALCSYNGQISSAAIVLVHREWTTAIDATPGDAREADHSKAKIP
jgi:hypothetical protein